MGLFSSLKKFGKKINKGLKHQAHKFGHAMKGTYKAQWKVIKNEAKKFTHDPVGALGDVAKVGLDAATFVTRPSSVLSNKTMMWQADNIAKNFGKEYTGHSLAPYVPHMDQQPQANQQSTQGTYTNPRAPNKNMRGIGRLFGTFMSGMSSSGQQEQPQAQSGGGGLGGLIGGFFGSGGSGGSGGGPAMGMLSKAKGLIGKVGGLFRKHKKHVKRKISMYKRKGYQQYNQMQRGIARYQMEAQNMYNQALANAEQYAQQFDNSLADPYAAEQMRDGGAPHMMGTDMASRSPSARYGPYGMSPAALIGANPATYGPPLQ